MSRFTIFVSLAMALLFKTVCFGERVDTTVTGHITTTSIETLLKEQDITYSKIKNARGDLVCVAEILTPPSKVKRYAVFFALDQAQNVTMSIPWDFKAPAPERWNKPGSWKNVLAGITTSETISFTSNPELATATPPELKTEPYKQNTHGKNPFIHFHPRLLGDFRQRLEERLTTQPALVSSVKENPDLINVDFMDDSSKTGLRYVLNVKKGYLPVKILEFQGDSVFRVADIVIGVSNSCYIPSKMDCVVFDKGNTPAYRERWYYKMLEINKKIPALELTGIATGLVDLNTDRVKDLPLSPTDKPSPKTDNDADIN